MSKISQAEVSIHAKEEVNMYITNMTRLTKKYQKFILSNFSKQYLFYTFC